MNNEVKITNFEELEERLHNWFWEEYLPKTDKAYLVNNSGILNFMMCFLDMLKGYAIPNLEDEYEDMIQDGVFDPKDNLIFRFFNDGNTLEDLADGVFSLSHLERFDPFGLESYQGTWEVATEVVQNYYHNEEE